ncbi:hypothetical protein LR48_Vigan02g116300 [Vigna angularis]|uniref:Uncharacterized protein n=1 Tax=Phaseolus angularis TaxID=3914 RepID=A0A0L9TWR3_PHAAN|nr:hypothetical protein LR48_Vigan02g116300 [Vigna angularis]
MERRERWRKQRLERTPVVRARNSHPTWTTLRGRQWRHDDTTVDARRRQQWRLGGGGSPRNGGRNGEEKAQGEVVDAFGLGPGKPEAIYVEKMNDTDICQMKSLNMQTFTPRFTTVTEVRSALGIGSVWTRGDISFTKDSQSDYVQRVVNGRLVYASGGGITKESLCSFLSKFLTSEDMSRVVPEFPVGFDDGGKLFKTRHLEMEKTRNGMK